VEKLDITFPLIFMISIPAIFQGHPSDNAIFHADFVHMVL